MKTLRLLFYAVVFLWGTSAFTQINSGNPALRFGTNTSYEFGIMPTNLPTSGTYGRSQAAADAYNDWLNSFVERCSNGSYRVKFDNQAQTVSEGIAYGMLLSAYAGDKTHFDGFWQFYKNSKNGNGVMNWMTDGCNGNARDNGATDAELDAAHALIIADEQWPGGSYLNDARTLLGAIKTYEMHPSTYQTLNGDAWGMGNTCRNPSYQSPAYYRQYALYDPSNASFWNNAVGAAYDLLNANVNGSTGLVSNWCDPNGNANACAGTTPNEYGSDACRNPWRMATDVLWHGSNTASDGYAICQDLANWLSGYENNLRGPMPQNASNPGQGSYKNGSYTTFALAPMAMGSNYQNSLNACYANVAGLGHDGAYFNETVRTLTLFVLTGNFWKPGSSGASRPPELLSAQTNEEGTQITLTFTADISSPSGATSFTLYVDGNPQGGAISGISAGSSVNQAILTVNGGVIAAGQNLTLSYTPGNIQGTDGTPMEAFSNAFVKNALLGNSTIIDDLEDGDGRNFLGGAWFTLNDGADGGLSTINPLSSEDNPFTPTSGGADGSSKAAYFEYSLNAGTFQYEPYVGIGVSLNPESVATGSDIVQDWTGSTGMSFWHKGASCIVQPFIPAVTDFGHYQYTVSASTSWQFVEFSWDELSQPSWAAAVPFTESQIQRVQWQVKGADHDDRSSGELWLDYITVEGLVPIALEQITLSPSTYSFDPETAGVDTFRLEASYTPTAAVYKELAWISSDPTIATVDDEGLVTAISAGTVLISATSKADSEVTGTCNFTVVGPEILPVSITLDPSTTTNIFVGEGLQIDATISPADATNTIINWTSSNPTVASVSASGYVTGESIGDNVTITATSDADNSVVATVTINVTPQGVESVTLDQTEVTIELGNSATVIATVLPETASNLNVIWTVENGSIAEVNNGVISSVAVGTTTVTATSEDNPNASATVTVTVIPVAVESVAISEETATVAVSANVSLTAIVTPENSSALVWSSQDENIVTVAGGVITGVSNGTAYVYATAVNDNTKIDSCLVTVTGVPVSTITLNVASQTIFIGDELQLSATISPTNASDPTVSWSTSSDLIATVDANGLVTAIGEGIATITVTANDGSGVNATATITVSPILVETITLNAETGNAMVGDEIQLVASVLPVNASDRTVNWSSSNTAVATVTNGIITAVGVGQTVITASSADAGDASDTYILNVSEVLPTLLAIQSEVGVLVNGTATIASTILPENTSNTTIIWSTDNAAIATIADGVVTGVSAGTAVITATSAANSSISATCTVTVSSMSTPVSSIALDPTSLNIGVEESQVISYTISPAEATNKNVTWTSSNSTVATVVNGIVTGVSDGNATITATTQDGNQIATCMVTVSAVTVTGVSLDQHNLSLAPTSAAVTLVATVLPTDASNKNVTWLSRNTNVITVTQNGVVSVQGIGTAFVVVETQAGGFKDSCEVTVSSILVTNITVSPGTLDLAAGGATATLNTLITPADASDRTISWSTSNPAVATVLNGVVTSGASGTAIITATANDGSGETGTCIVTVSSVPVQNVTLNESAITISENGSFVLVATVLPENATNKNVTWTSLNPTIASVSSTGVVTGLSASSTPANILVTTADGGHTAICAVTVQGNVIPVTSIQLPTTFTISLGSTQPLVATVLPTNATNKALNWVTSNDAIVSVDTDGNLTAESIGIAVIGVSSVANTGVSATCVVTVTNVQPTSVVLDRTSLSLNPNGTGTISASVLPAGTSQSVTWLSSAPSIASVDANGTVTALASGQAQITATAIGTSITSTPCIVTVTAVNITGVTVSPATLRLVAGGSASLLTATLQPTGVTSEITWSLNPVTSNVATVSSNGLVSPVSSGTVRVRATATANGVFGECIVSVVDLSILNTIISSVQSIHDAAVVGTGLGEYTASSKVVLQGEIDMASAVANSTSSTQAQIDAAISNLEDARDDFLASAVSDATIIFDGEHGNLTLLATYWFSFNDAEPGGGSTIEPLSNESVNFTTSYGGVHGNDSAAKISYSLDAGSLSYSPFGGMGMSLNKNGDDLPYDLSDATGISFWYKSDHDMYIEIALTSITDDCNYQYLAPAASDWTQLTLSWNDFTQYNWGNQVAWDPTQIVKFQWKIQTSAGSTGELWVDDVAVVGTVLDLPDLPSEDLQNLEDAIDAAIEKRDSTYRHVSLGTYDREKYDSFLHALDYAIALASSGNASNQDYIDALDALNESIDELDATYTPVGVVDVEIVLSTYPNPVSDILSVESSEAISSVMIYSSIGSKLLEVEADGMSTSIDVAELAGGVYSLSVTLANGKVAQTTFVK